MTQGTDATRARERAAITPRRINLRTISALATAAMIALPATSAAQHSAHALHAAADSMPGMEGMHSMPSMQGETEASMSGPMAEMSSHPHMRMTASRPATAADSARARAVADTLRRVLAKYRDVSVAEADGYKMFAPHVKQQRVYHFTRKWSGVKAAFTFDAAAPTSLLYTRDAAGRFTLTGAMYTAPRRASEDDLNARVPLSIAHWHEHINICRPKGSDDRWKETRNGKLLFGPAGAIATEADCTANNGRWNAQLFGWMVHANVFTGEDLGVVWGDSHHAAGMAH